MEDHQPVMLVDSMDTLSRLLLAQPDSAACEMAGLRKMDRGQFDSLLALAHTNHVVIRAMEVFRNLTLAWDDAEQTKRVEESIAAEQARVSKAMVHLRTICDAFAKAGLDVTVIKSLDHWPDFGSDLDLYTNANSVVACNLMQDQFAATIAPRSWGDRLAGKWNFYIPGLPEAIEIHMGRLGQTGEQLALAANIPFRSRTFLFDGYRFPVPSASDRIMISTLQRMYRHFYFRLCDIVDSAQLAASGELDYEDLRRSAQAYGIWEGTATYLVLVSDYVQKYKHSSGVLLPGFVKQAARFDGTAMYTGGNFLRVHMVPQAAGLYGSQLFDSLRKGELKGSARLGLLPWLATAAAIGYKITGSDKGIW